MEARGSKKEGRREGTEERAYKIGVEKRAEEKRDVNVEDEGWRSGGGRWCRREEQKR